MLSTLLLSSTLSTIVSRITYIKSNINYLNYIFKKSIVILRAKKCNFHIIYSIQYKPKCNFHSLFFIKTLKKFESSTCTIKNLSDNENINLMMPSFI
jgi:hypothetical protein